MSAAVLAPPRPWDLPAANQRQSFVRSFRADAEAAGTVTAHSLRPRPVPVRRIVGSVGRAHELAPNFRPRKRYAGDDDRYKSVVSAIMRGKALPPIDVYKLGRCYYVVDGNHRVAAALANGQREIDAVVTEFVPNDDTVAQHRFIERRAFERVTGLTLLGANQPSSYPLLVASIRAVAAERDIATDGPEAVTRWYFDVYQPAATRLRRARLWDLFPGLRTADIFVLLARFRDDHSRHTGVTLEWTEATDRFLACFGRNGHKGRFHVPLLHALLRRRLPGALLGYRKAAHISLQ